MNRSTLLLILLLPAGAGAAGPAWNAMQQGLRAYEQGDFQGAATNFDAAAAAAAKEKFDPATAAFNRANAQLKSGQAEAASSTYAEALRTTDLGLQAGAYHNRGNAMLGIAGEQEQQQKFKEAIKSVDEAMTMYERSMMLAPRDRDPKVNYELAARKRTELEEKLKQQEQQQQQNQDQNQDQDKDQQKKDQKDSSKQDQQKGDDNQQQKPEDEKSDQQQGQQDQKQKDQEQKPEDEQGQEQQQKAGQKPAEEMTPQEAAMLLDAMRQQEQAQRERITAQRMKSNAGKLAPVDKDW